MHVFLKSIFVFFKIHIYGVLELCQLCTLNLLLFLKSNHGAE